MANHRATDMMQYTDDFYRDLIASLDNNTVLRERNDQGQYVPVSCTREFAEMMECTPEEFIRAETENPLSTVYPDDREDGAYLLEHGHARDGSTHLIVRKRTFKGKIIWVDLHYAFFENRGRQYAYCNYFDVTSIKENEARMVRMHDELTRELRAVSDESLAVIRSNLSRGVVEEVSGKDLYDVDKPGTPIEELLKVRLANMPIEADRERYLETFSLDKIRQTYERGDEPQTLVIFSRRQSGRQCFIRYSAGIRKDPYTGDITIYGIETEYNAEKVAEILNQKVLARQYDMITYIVGGEYGVVIGDAASIKQGSIFPRQMSGSYSAYIADQVLPVAVGDDDERAQLAEALSLPAIERHLSQDEYYTVDVTCEIEGELYYKRFTFYLVDRAARFYVLLKTDYTEVQREQLLRNEHLKYALEEANQANVAKTAFLSSMSHEIRTPMNAIIGLDSIALKDPALPEATRGYLEKIGDSARHLLGLINDILDMSRIESGRMVLKNEEFSFNRMLEQINTMIGGQCMERRLHYDCHVLGKLKDYYIGDDMKLKQVLINILGNAVKFTQPGGSVRFLVEPLKEYGDKSTLRFTISDTGIGMDEEYLPRLFDAFTQEDASRTTTYGGSGLGMAITKNIVEMMSGDISVTSRKGEGSTFVVHVTLGNTDRRDEQSQEVRPQELHVLVIDDDPIACEHAHLVLDEVGIANDTCLTGKDALEMIRVRHARRESYNLMLVDLHMPEQDGIQVTREIRNLVGNESAIIILTAYNWEDVMEEALVAGVDSFMSKPLYSANVLEQFTQAIQRKGMSLAGRNQVVDLAGRRVLLAEDMEINAEIMKQLLTMKDMAVDVAENGRIALDMFADSETGYYDAILMDVRMPVMDGLTATSAIRALQRPDAGTIPIIAMTANAFDEDVQRSLQAGMNAHLSKPVEPERLYETLGELM